ncbi:nuclease-related domain-containing protein [Bacillus sp. mrc49]|uniref:nuclease-related domain-containing protein n=1 Tax=Bacillus sp. mrc49 TaxID=2054913 RepID=UPI000C27081C|nr:nuclease-related domain-containing protein [Bacillus sp. mrc49]PJN89275.1 NERD nuclease [Bacillus sp. mrc49]
MIIKDCKMPLKIDMLESLMRRLPPGHERQPAINEDIKKIRAGYKGEYRVFNLLKALPQKDYLLFHDLRLSGSPFPFQMDILILTPFFLLIVEVKNIAGEMFFDNTFNQLIRTNPDGKTEAFDDPILQVSMQRKHLLDWLKTRNINNLPVETLVVSANSSTIIRAANKEISGKVIRKDRILLQIAELNNKLTEEILSRRAIKRLSNVLLDGHTAFIPKPLETYGIPSSALQTGVFCQKCHAYSMERHRKWICRTCLDTSHDAHISALIDYVYLVKPSITNSEFRNFLQLHSPSSAKKLLTSMKLKHSGHTKGRVYLLHSLIEG